MNDALTNELKTLVEKHGYSEVLFALRDTLPSGTLHRDAEAMSAKILELAEWVGNNTNIW